MSASAARRHFLFRNDQGTIDAATWRANAGVLVLAAAVLTALWLVLAPYTHHDLKTTAFIAPMTILAFTYLMVYAFAVLLIAISFTNLGAKRLRDLGRPTGLAGLVPLLALFSGAAHWLQPQVSDVISVWYVVGLDVALVAAIVWSVVELGFSAGRG